MGLSKLKCRLKRERHDSHTHASFQSTAQLVFNAYLFATDTVATLGFGKLKCRLREQHDGHTHATFQSERIILVLYFGIFGNHSPLSESYSLWPHSPRFIRSRSAIPSWSLCSERLRGEPLLTSENVMILASLRLIGNLLQCLLPWLAPHVLGAALR